jgi:hypothetical protein
VGKEEGRPRDTRTQNERDAQGSCMYVRWEVIDSTGCVEGGGEDHRVRDKIVCENVVEATSNLSGCEGGVREVLLQQERAGGWAPYNVMSECGPASIKVLSYQIRPALPPPSHQAET